MTAQEISKCIHNIPELFSVGMLAEILHETYSEFPNDPYSQQQYLNQSFSTEIKDSPSEIHTISYLDNN